MCTESRASPRPKRRQSGLSLIELIIFIIIVGVGVAGILVVYGVTTKSSADPQVRKQMLAIAEALLEEIELQPFTFCDPDDPQASTAQSATLGATGCLNKVEAIGPEAAYANQANNETRTSADSPFDNVNDYNGLVLNPASDINGNTIAGYTASVVVAQQQLEASVPLSETLRITVTVTRGSDTLSLSGYRTRYAPRTTP
jgi:MSHA pilin protein MshD